MFKISIVLALIGASVFFFVGGPGAFADRSWRELWNLGHVIYFALMTLLLAQWRTIHQISMVKRWMLVILLSTVIGLAIELLQYGTHRSPDVMDISRNFCGVFLVLAMHPVFLHKAHQKINTALKFFVLVFLLFHLSPLIIALTDELAAKRQFPVLSNFETAFELDRWHGSAGRKIVDGFGREGKQMQIDLGTQQYSGVGLNYLPNDWSEYEFVNAEIYLDAQHGLELIFRIHDYDHQTRVPRYRFNDRFNKRIKLQPGWNNIQIDLDDVKQAPDKRKMDMQKISDISFFSVGLKQPQTLYLDQIYLSNQ